MNPFHLLGDLGAAQDESHLGSVPVGDDQVPAPLDHAGQMCACLTHSYPLIFDSLVLAIQDQRIAADGDDGDLALSHWCVLSNT